MEQPVIEAEARTANGKNIARRLRRAGRVPGVLYGSGKESIPVTLDPRQLGAVLRSPEGHNVIFLLRVKDGESTPAMIVEPQFEPVKGTVLHVDLKRIAMDKKLRVSVAVVPVGEAQGVKTEGGILELVMREVEVECLPADIPQRLPVPVEALRIGDSIRVEDLQKQIGEAIRLLSDPQAVLCHVVALKVEEAKPAEAVAEVPAEPEVIKKGKAAEEEEESEESRKSRE